MADRVLESNVTFDPDTAEVTTDQLLRSYQGLLDSDAPAPGLSLFGPSPDPVSDELERVDRKEEAAFLDEDVFGPLTSVFEQKIKGHRIRNAHETERREVLEDANYRQALGLGSLDLNEGLEFEGQKGLVAADALNQFNQYDADAAFVQPTPVLDPAEDSGNPGETFRNVTNFLFSNEMGLLGIKWTDEAFEWNKDNFYHQLEEHPYATAFTLAAYIVPTGAAWLKGARIAKRGAALAGIAGAPEVAQGAGILGTSLRYRFKEHSDFVRKLAFSPEINEGKQFFSEGVMRRIKAAGPDADLTKLVKEKDLRRMLIGDYHSDRFFQLQKLASSGQLTPSQRAQWGIMKNFGNKYFKAINDVDKRIIEDLDTTIGKMKLGRALAAAPTGLGIKKNQLIYKYMAGAASYDDVVRGAGDDVALYADAMRTKITELTKAQFDEGFIGEGTYRMFVDEFGGGHLPAVHKGTPGFEDLGRYIESAEAGKFGGLLRKRKLDIGKTLTGPTTLHRGKYTTRAAVLENIDELITDPKSLTIGGLIKDTVIFQSYRSFRDLTTDYIRGNPKLTHFFKSADDFDALPSYAQKEWLSFDELNKQAPGIAATLERMVGKGIKEGNLEDNFAAMGKRLPVMHRNIVEKYFGAKGSAREAGGSFSKFFELMTSVHKTSRTALNPPTHMSNLLGNFMFLAMAGSNPFSREMLKDGQILTKGYIKIAKQSTAAGKKAGGQADAAWSGADEVMTPENLRKIFGDDDIIKTVHGDEVRISDIFSDDLMKDLHEYQSFDSVEGFKNLKANLQRMESLETSGWSDKAVNTVARSLAGFTEVKGVKSTLNTMSAAYLGEDMIPKMMYVLNLTRKGWGRDAIIREVGRRLPQYRTVGQIPASARKVILPWITFPAEVARITKNNLMDNPIPMMAWMKAPAVAQSVMTAAGLGIDYDELHEAIDASPPWAVRYQTAFLKGETAPETLGAIGGASIGGITGAAGGIPGAVVGGAYGALAGEEAGGIPGMVGGAALGAFGGARGGPMGAAAGATTGALGGVALGRKSTAGDDSTLKNIARAWPMDFLPHGALSLASLHPSEWEKVDPLNPTPTTGAEGWMTAKDLLPVEPLAIAMPLLDLFMGQRGGFGKTVESQSMLEGSNKLSLGLLGFLMPPMIQKYGMKLEEPGGAIYPTPMADIHEANGGVQTIPPYVTATASGLLLGGLTFLGAKKLGLPPSALKGAAQATAAAATTGRKAASSALLAGGIGASAGAEINTRRLMTDLGMLGDPRTGDKGDWTLDFLANTFYGVNKSWKSTPAQAEFNTALRAKRWEPIKSAAQKIYMDGVRSGSEAQAAAGASSVYKVLQYQYAGNPEIADTKFVDWLDRKARLFSSLPVFAGMSEEYINIRIIALRDALKNSKSKILKARLATLQAEATSRRVRSSKGLRIVTGLP